MKYFIDRKQLNAHLRKSYSEDMACFSTVLHNELISLLAYSIKTTSENKNVNELDYFKGAISHIARQKGLMSYCTLSSQQQLCVDIFAQQAISRQEHIVFHRKNYLDTLRILYAQTSSLETKEKQGNISLSAGFNFGFVSLSNRLKSLILHMVSMKTGAKHD